MHFELLIGLLYERKSLIFAEELKDRGVGKEMSKEIREEKRKDERRQRRGGWKKKRVWTEVN